MKRYYRIGIALVVIGGALAIWGAFQMPHTIAAVIIGLVVGIAASVPTSVLMVALLRRPRGGR